MEVKPIVVSVPRIGDVRRTLEYPERDVCASQNGADGQTRRPGTDDQRVGDPM
jgi:hypothetical protein